MSKFEKTKRLKILNFESRDYSRVFWCFNQSKMWKRDKIAKTKAMVDFETLELEKDVAELRKELMIAEAKLFESQRESLRRRRRPQTTKSYEAVDSDHISIKKTVEEADRVRLEANLKLYQQTSGIVIPFCDDLRCCVTFEICLGNEVVGEHAVEILKNDVSSSLGKRSMPLGFQYKAIVKKYGNICVEGFVLEMHQALGAYYSRLDQINKLKGVIPSDFKLFYNTDGTMVELSFLVGDTVNNWVVGVSIRLAYDLTEDRPSGIDTLDDGLEPQYIKILEGHLGNFEQYPVDQAFLKFSSDFSVHNGNFAIMAKKNVKIVTMKSQAAKSRIQNSHEYQSDSEIHEHNANRRSDVNLSPNNSLWTLINSANHRHSEIQTRRKTQKSQLSRQPIAVENRTSLETKKIVHRVRTSKANAAQRISLNASKYVASDSEEDAIEEEPPSKRIKPSNATQITLNSSKYVPSESESSEEEQPKKKQKRTENKRKVIAPIKKGLGIIQSNARIWAAKAVHGKHTTEKPKRRLMPQQQQSEAVDSLEEETEEDELDIREKNEAISKVTKWLRSTPLPEEYLEE